VAQEPLGRVQEAIKAPRAAMDVLSSRVTRENDREKKREAGIGGFHEDVRRSRPGGRREYEYADTGPIIAAARIIVGPPAGGRAPAGVGG
jgi:hypothetical protein